MFAKHFATILGVLISPEEYRELPNSQLELMNERCSASTTRKSYFTF